MAITESFVSSGLSAQWTDGVGWGSGTAHEHNATNQSIQPTLASSGSDTCAIRNDSWGTSQSCQVTAGVTSASSAPKGYIGAGVLFQSDGSGWLVTYGGTNNQLRLELWNMTSGGFPGAATATWNNDGSGITAGDTVKIDYDGTDIVCSVNGTTRITYTRIAGNSSGVPAINMFEVTSTREAEIDEITMTGEVVASDPGCEVYSVLATATTSTPSSSLVSQTSGRKFQNSSGSDIILTGDTPWHLFHRLTPADRDAYLNDCVDNGINAIIVSMMVVGSSSYQTTSYNNVWGVPMFTDNDDWTTYTNDGTYPGGTVYLDLVIDGLKACEARGINVLLAPAYVGFQGSDEGWNSNTGTHDHMVTQTNAQMKTWATAIANRINSAGLGAAGILWTHCCDADADAVTNLLDRVNNIHDGIDDVFGPGVHTAHGTRNNRARAEFSLANGYDFDTVYADVTTSESSPIWINQGYNGSPAIPAVYFEGRYENHASAPTGTELRGQMYWAMYGGHAGFFYGNENVWDFPSASWESALSDTARQDIQHTVGWWEAGLVPDYTNITLTAGYGSIANNTYSACAVSADNKRVYCWTPDNGTLTFNFSNLTGFTASGTWMNPRTGATQEAFASAELTTLGAKQLTPPTNEDWALKVVAAAAPAEGGVDRFGPGIHAATSPVTAHCGSGGGIS